MARLPKNPEEAVAELGLKSEATVVVVGPAEGYAEAMADAVGTKGTLLVQHPPPDLTARKKAVQIVDELPADASGDPVIAWIPVVPLSGVRELVGHVADGGALWLILPKTDRDVRASVTEGDAKRALLPLGWRETKVVPLSTDALGVRFHRRR